MNRFWHLALEPLLDAVAPRRLLEIGAESGALTGRLLEWASAHDAVIHSIDPRPQFNVKDWNARFGERLIFHRKLSLEALPDIEDIDIAFIDGDHNWYTVINELRLLDRHEPPPVIALHDVGWPYGRRDLYYAPETIPEEARQPYAREGVRPDARRLGEPGLNSHLFNALQDGGPRNGVRTAIEDFCEESAHPWRFVELPGLFGLGVLADAERVRTTALGDVMARLERAPALRKVASEIETHRVWAEIRRADARERLVERGEAAEALTQEAQALRETVAEHEQETATLRETVEHERERQEAELESAQLINKRLQEDLQDRDDVLALELDRIRVRAERAEAQRAQHERRAGGLELQLEELRDDHDTAVGELERLRGQLLETVSERDAARSAAEHEQRRGAEAGSRERQAEERARAREHRAGTAEAARAAADSSVARLRAQLDHTEAELSRIHARHDALELRLREARADRDRVLAELQSERATPATEPSGGDLAGSVDEPVAPAPPRAEDAPATTKKIEPEQELVERRHFLERIVGLLPAGEQISDVRDPLALPEISDVRGFLVGCNERPADPARSPTVDVIVCIHDAPADVRRCLWSLTARSSRPFHLILVDDGSGPETAALLDRAVRAHPVIELIRRSDPPHGYTLAANDGLRRSSADYVALLNSDTVVSSGWLERLIDCGESDERIGILGPLSNAASHQSVPELRSGGAWATNELPRWLETEGIAAIVRRASDRERPRFPFINGFCYVIKRQVIDAIGYFDEENFASGYCEENDYSYRALTAGFELAVADDAYVFHTKSRSYTSEGRNERAKENYQVFLDKHDRERINQLVRGMEENTALAPLRAEVAKRLSSPVAAADLIVDTAEPLRVVMILPGLGKGGSGGSHSVYQEVRGMRDLGIPATIALSAHAWDRAQSAYDDAADIFRPFADLDELAAITADAHVISATHFKSVAMLAHLRERRDDFLPAYYVQDYEPFFMLPDHPDHEEAYGSYTAVPDTLLFAKTHWLCNALGHAHCVHVAKVEPSIDSALFRPGHRSGEGPVRVVAMVRWRTPRRQPHGTVAQLSRLQREHGELVETITFGCEPTELRRVSDDPDALERHRGLLKRPQVAELLRSADVFLDFSTYQAFGRSALEAMACGSTAIVPRIGGAAEFAVDGVNALVVDTCNEDATYAALSSLVGDRERLRLLQAGAMATASRYSIVRAALSEYVLFNNEYHRRVSPPALDPQQARQH